VKTRIPSNEEFARLLVGRTIVTATAGKTVEGFDDEDPQFISDPTIVLDDGTEITFDVDDHGSGTYEVWAEAKTATKPKKSKPKKSRKS
jgi:hypothetical protein